jgi:hypothetical protein
MLEHAAHDADHLVDGGVRQAATSTLIRAPPRIGDLLHERMAVGDRLLDRLTFKQQCLHHAFECLLVDIHDGQPADVRDGDAQAPLEPLAGAVGDPATPPR